MSEPNKGKVSTFYYIEEVGCIPRGLTFEIKDGKIIAITGQIEIIKDAKE